MSAVLGPCAKTHKKSTELLTTDNIDFGGECVGVPAGQLLGACGPSVLTCVASARRRGCTVAVGAAASAGTHPVGVGRAGAGALVVGVEG